MPAAARLADSTTHGGVILPPVEFTVFIGKMPAATMGSMHVCSIPYPHPMVSAFPKGSATVFIGGKPALRTSDTCICGAGSAVGEPTVMIGG